MSEIELAVEIREQSGKGVARKLRAAGRIPAVLYGQGKAPVSLALSPVELWKLLEREGANALIDLRGDAAVDGRTVLVKELQREPVRGKYLHADLFEIDVRHTISVSVPIHLVGTPVGVSMEGGLLDHALRELEVECLPRAIPESIDIDVSGLHLGDSIHVEEVTVPDGVTVETPGDTSIVSIVAPAREEEPEAEEVEGEEGVEAAPAAEGEEEGEGAEAPAEGAEEKPSEG